MTAVEEEIKNGNIKHDLKILPQYFEAVIKGRKKFELRKNDRDFNVGCILLNKEALH